MELSKLLVDTKSAWVDYPGLNGFEVHVAALSRPELIKLRKSCITQRLNRKTKQLEEELNEDKFVMLFAKAVILDWKGLTIDNLSHLVLINTEGVGKDDLLEYSEENAEMLLTNSTEFDNWINEVVFDIDNFRS